MDLKKKKLTSFGRPLDFFIHLLITCVYETFDFQCIVNYLAIAKTDTQHIGFLKICHILDLVGVVLGGEEFFHLEISICQTVRILQIDSLWYATEQCVFAGHIIRTGQNLNHRLSASAIHSRS